MLKDRPRSTCSQALGCPISVLAQFLPTFLLSPSIAKFTVWLRIAELSHDVGRQRPLRRFHSDKKIRPYNLVEASGYAILQETEKGKFAGTDEYMAHSVIIGDSKSTKSVLLVTDRRVIYAHKGDIFGHWDEEWSHTWSDLKEKPKRSAKGVEFLLKDDKKKKSFPFSLGGSAKKIKVHIPDPKRAEWLVGKIAEAMEMKR